MKGEELIKKLESAELPMIEIQSHRRRLKVALLQSGYFEGSPGGVAVSKSKMKGIGDMPGGPISWRPVWKPALVGILTMALIVGAALFAPPLFGPSTEVLAAGIAQNSPEVQRLLGDDSVIVKEVKLVDGVGCVVCEASIGTFVFAEVDLDKKEVVRAERIKLPELTEEEKTKAIRIAEAAPEVRRLLYKGASIDKVSPIFGTITLREGENGEMGVETSVTPAVALVLDGEKWVAHVDIGERKVKKISEPRPVASVEASGYKEGEVKKIDEGGPLPIPSMAEEEERELTAAVKINPEAQESRDREAETNRARVFEACTSSIEIGDKGTVRDSA